MLFWVICGALTVLTGLYIGLPMVRARRADAAANPDVALYKAQLAELDRDVARGTIDATEAETARTEISRRLLAASHRSDRQSAAGPKTVAALVTFAIVVGISLVTYIGIGSPDMSDQPLAARLAEADQRRAERPSQVELETAAPAPPPVDADQEYLDAVARLREVMDSDVGDAQGWSLLAEHEAQLRNYPAARRAQARVVELKGEEASVQDLQLWADLLVAAADGYVSPETESVVRQMLNRDPENVAARYYMGSLYNQTGRPDIAFVTWRRLIEAAPDSFHVALARAQIEGAARRAGTEYTLPPETGPSVDQIENAQDMSDEDREAMIQNMVAGLAARLANDGGPPSEWSRLIRAYMVLGEEEAAQSVLDEALGVFGDVPEAVAEFEALRAEMAATE